MTDTQADEPTAEPTAFIERDHLPLYLDKSLIRWVRSQVRPKGPFAGPGHVAEFALHRLMDDERAILTILDERPETRHLGRSWLVFKDAMHRQAAAAGTVALPVPEGTDRMHVSVSVPALEWVAERCKPGGPFGNPGHAVEVALHALMVENKAVISALKESAQGRTLALKPWAPYGPLIAATKPQRKPRPNMDQETGNTRPKPL